MIVKVKDEHIEKGIEKYQGKRVPEFESLFKNGKINAEVFKFNDGRFLVKFLNLKTAFLYPSEESLFDSIQLD